MENSLFIEITGSGEHVMCCPFCGEQKGHLYFNPDKHLYGVKGWYHCKKCDAKGNVFKLAKALGIEASDLISGEAVVEEVVFPELSFLPEGTKNVVASKSLSVVPFINYLNKRGITQEQAVKYRLHYCSRGMFRDRLIIPCFEDDKLCYYLGRTIRDDAKRYLYPKNGTVSFKKSEVLYNIDNCRSLDILCVAEGAISSWAVSDALSMLGHKGDCVALLGKDMSKTQMEKILSLNSKEICVILDGDAVNNSLEICKNIQISGYNNVSVIILPDGKDPDSIDMVELLKLIAGRNIYNRFDYSNIIKLKLGIQ